MMPHIGCHDGVWYGMGYNFAGVPMGSFFGLKIAQKILGLPDGRHRLRTRRLPYPAALSRQSVVPAARDALVCVAGLEAGEKYSIKLLSPVRLGLPHDQLSSRAELPLDFARGKLRAA